MRGSRASGAIPISVLMTAVMVLWPPSLASANHAVTERVSTGPAETGGTASGTDLPFGDVSPDGSHIAFTTDRRLVPEDTDDSPAVYVRSGNSIELVSPGSSGDVQSFRVRIDDSGTNGVRGDSDDRIFATQGVYVP
jgi:hypothetical protein